MSVPTEESLEAVFDLTDVAQPGCRRGSASSPTNVTSGTPWRQEMHVGEPTPIIEALNWTLACGAGDGNRTRTISLGICTVRACHMA